MVAAYWTVEGLIITDRLGFLWETVYRQAWRWLVCQLPPLVLRMTAASHGWTTDSVSNVVATTNVVSSPRS